MSIYAFHRQLHPPTGVEQALLCNFYSSHEKNLVLADVNQLSVYRINHNVEIKPHEKMDPSRRKPKLELVASFSLFGNIISMQAVRLAGASRDSLLVSFREAKLSLLDYDPDVHDLKTSSLHYFEEYELTGGHIQQSVYSPIVRVDPEGRCAAMLLYGTRLVILPFRRDTVVEDVDPVMGTSKSPVMPSYTIDLRELDDKITNVQDFHFLHGYYEPTIFLLYEPLPTCSGRIAVRKDSYGIIAISLNLSEKVHPIIWSLGGLPYDCTMAFPVPKPIGGVLVFSINALIYLNQSVPPYAVSLNDVTNISTDFLLKQQEAVKMTLDSAQACFISGEQLVLSLKGGELYVLTLVVDSMRAIRGFNFDKAAASVLTTCMCNCEGGLLFLGSRLGNSLLLKYTKKANDVEPAIKQDKIGEEPPQKKKKSDTLGDWIASDVTNMEDLDELEVYGSEPRSSGERIMSYTFEVCDSILNIGPCGNIVMGEPAFLSEEFGNTLDPDLELVTTSGYGKNGALSVLQRAIRPQVVTTFELPGTTDMWTVIGTPINTEEAASNKKEGGDAGTHSLLILSRGDSSMVLQTGQEIMELDTSGFCTTQATIAAGNVGGNKYVVQVVSGGVYLLDGVEQLQHVPIEMSGGIQDCEIVDPYVVLLGEDGSMAMLTLVAGSGEPDGQKAKLELTRPYIANYSKVVTLTAYRDVSGIFTTSYKSDAMEEVTKSGMNLDSSATDLPDAPIVDDEDELLYGDTETRTDQQETPSDDAPDTTVKEEASSTSAPEPITASYWACVARRDGSLELYSLPQWKLAFHVMNFPLGQRVLSDFRPGSQNQPAAIPKQMADIPVVCELRILGMGNLKSKPYLIARVEDELLIYEVFPHPSVGCEDGLRIRFRKVPHGLIVREKRVRKKTAGEDKKEPKGKRLKWIRPFDDVSGYSGVFLCGPYPHWLFMSARGAMRMHPMSIDSWVTSFAAFNNINCPKGFLYFNKVGALRISVLPTHLSYDAPWPIRKVALRATPHNVLYHPESKTYPVVTSVPEKLTRKVLVISGEGDKEFEEMDRPARFIYPTIERFSVQLFSPVSWEAIPNTKQQFEEFEHVTCMKYVTLKSQGTVSGMKGFITLGTTLTYGEEPLISKGRILIFDIIEVVPEPGQPLTKNKIKMVYDKEQKGPVSAIDHVNGYLVTAIGQKIYIWTLKNNDLSGVAFIDTHVYICSIATVKNMILVGDVLKSVALLRYQTELKVLSQVSRDVKPLEVYSLAFMIDNTNMCFLVSDRDKNLLVYTYQPEVRESHGGQRLIRAADINIGSHVNSFFRIRCKLQDPSTEKRATVAVERRHINYFATLDGSIGYVLPITEKIYRRLAMLQNALTVRMAHHAGLNPKAYRLYTSEKKILTNPSKNILDGDLLWKFLHMSITEQNELAKRIGSSIDNLIEDLMDIDRHTAHF